MLLPFIKVARFPAEPVTGDGRLPDSRLVTAECNSQRGECQGGKLRANGRAVALPISGDMAGPMYVRVPDPMPGRMPVPVPVSVHVVVLEPMLVSVPVPVPVAVQGSVLVPVPVSVPAGMLVSATVWTHRGVTPRTGSIGGSREVKWAAK